MIRMTIKNYKRRAKSWEDGDSHSDMHIEVVFVETWWFLFIPIYSRQILHKSNL